MAPPPIGRFLEARTFRTSDTALPVNECVHETSKAFVISLNDPVAIPPTFKDVVSGVGGLVSNPDQPVLVTPAKSDWRFAVMVAPEVCAVGAGRLSVPPLPVKIEKVRCPIVMGVEHIRQRLKLVHEKLPVRRERPGEVPQGSKVQTRSIHR